eukprot:12549231-Ditylum_brightwellii.AAC.1
MEDDIVRLKLQLAEEKAEQDRLHLFARCLQREVSTLRQDLQNAAGDQNADTGMEDLEEAEEVKATILRYVARAIEERNIIMNDKSILEKEIRALKEKIQSFGVDPDTDNETLATMDDTTINTDNGDDGLSKFDNKTIATTDDTAINTDNCDDGLFKLRRKLSLTNVFQFRRRSTGGSLSSVEQEKCKGLKKKEGGDIVAESLLWDRT